MTVGEAKDRELDAILKLIKLTQAGQLTWNATAPWGELVDTERRKIESVFSCQHEGHRLRIYLERVRVDRPSGEFGTSGFSGLLNSLPGATATTYPYWQARTVLEFTDIEGRTLWRFPSIPALNDLMIAVRYNVAGVKDFFDKLLADNN